MNSKLVMGVTALMISQLPSDAFFDSPEELHD
jgi:hypothetical protein